jgi:integrase
MVFLMVFSISRCYGRIVLWRVDMALTDVKVRTAKPDENAYGLADTGGLYLLVTPSGGKLWRWNYRYDGKQKTMSFGKYPDVSLADARDAHQEARKALANGDDPMAQRKAERIAANIQIEAEKASNANSFKIVALRWHEWWAPGVGSDTADYILRRLEADVFPVFGHRPIADIKPVDIRNVILAIERGEGEGRRFKGKGARDVAQRQHGTISQIYRYAVTHELAEVNPAAAFKPGDVLKPHKTQNRAHIEPHRLPGFLIAMDNYNGQSVVKKAMKLMALTFLRTQELLGAPWSELNLDKAIWKIPAERMKKDRPHFTPLAKQAVTLLHDLKLMAGNKLFVFPGLINKTEDRTINGNSILDALNDIGFKGVMTGHGYRGLARTILAETGFDKNHVELQLAHANDDKTEAAYNHALYLPQRAAMLQWWADYLDTELEKGRTSASTSS